VVAPLYASPATAQASFTALAEPKCADFTVTTFRDAAHGRGSTICLHPVRMKIIQPGVAARRLRRVNDPAKPATL